MKTHSRHLILAIAFFAFAASASFAQASAEKNVTAFGAKINYVEAGDPARPKVILLHGLGANTSSCAFTIPALAANYRVIKLDQVGVGRSDRVMLKYRVGTYVETKRSSRFSRNKPHTL